MNRSYTRARARLELAGRAKRERSAQRAHTDENFRPKRAGRMLYARQRGREKFSRPVTRRITYRCLGPGNWRARFSRERERARVGTTRRDLLIRFYRPVVHENDVPTGVHIYSRGFSGVR